MLERVIYAALAVAALGTAGCTTIQGAETQNEAGSFYKSRKITKESSKQGIKEQEARYEYKNGIEARITYIKSDDTIDVKIEIDEDPKNILVRKLPVQNTPSGSSYRITIHGEKVTRTIGFCWNESMMQIVLEGNRVKEVTADDKNFPWYILFEKRGWEALPGAEMDLEVGYHIEQCRKK